jgi:polyhydroxybutyrate depolymerase
VALHGRGIDADDMVRLTGMNETADREGFLVAYPNGREDSGGGRVWPWFVDEEGEVRQPQEVEFLARLVEEVARLAPVDAGRVYLSGFSNGAILAYVAARDLPDRFAAIGAVAGFVGMKRVPPTSVSILHIHGTRDRFVPYHGGRSARRGSAYVFPPLSDALLPWLEAAGCHTLRSTDSVRDPADPTLVIRTEIYGPGRDGAEVEVVAIEGGGHTWPGRAPLVSYMGKWTTAFSGSDRIWEFCRRRALRREGGG